ncbi:hypothetical protein QQX98_002883 [Neonectria punicea]|uniref:Uncharacterized protein n=1 Tax=Neonectria punicea TaxID=979145 RepID=A0ABR1HHK1_9HYPO
MTAEFDSEIWDSRFTDNAVATSVVATGSRSRAGAEAGNLLQDVMMLRSAAYRDVDIDDKSEELIPVFTRFKAADCYSFGLSLWETINRGKSFIESENPVDVLDRMFENKENAVLDVATSFFKDWQANLTVIDEEESKSRFGAALRRQPPWGIQCAAFDFIQHTIGTEQDEERKAQAYLQLAIIYRIGYGVAADSSKALLQLKSANQYNQVAKAILERVRPAPEPNVEEQENGIDDQEALTYRNSDIFLDDSIERSGKPDEQFLTLGPINISSFDIFTRLVKRGRYKPHQLSEAFTDACRDGHLEAAILFAQHCTDI